MNPFEVALSLHKTGNYRVDIINVVSVARHVKNHLKQQVSTSSRIDHIANNIITSSITPCVRNAAKGSKVNVCNLKTLLSVIQTALLVMYASQTPRNILTLQTCHVQLDEDYYESNGLPYCERHARLQGRKDQRMERRKTRLLMM